MPFSFRFCLYKYHPSCPTTRACLPPKILTNDCRTENLPFSPMEDYCFSTLLTLQWKVIARLQPDKNRSLSERVYKQHLHRCWLSYRPATGHSCGWLRLIPSRRPVNSRPAKRPGCVNRPMLPFVPLLCPAIIATCRPVDNRNV